MKMRLLQDRLLVKQEEEKLSDVIAIPDSAKKKLQRGVVLQVGPGKYHEKAKRVIPMSVKVGDTVYFEPYSGKSVEADTVMLNESQLMLVDPC